MGKVDCRVIPDCSKSFGEINPIACLQAVCIQLDQVRALVVAVKIVANLIDGYQRVVTHNGLHSLSDLPLWINPILLS